MTDVLLVVPPFASAALPVLGPSLLVAALRRDGLHARVLYANVTFAAHVGYDRYRRFTLSSWRMHGDLLFAPAAWGHAVPDEAVVFGPRVDAVTEEDWRVAAETLPAYFAEVRAQIAEAAPAVVGLSSVFQQNVPSVALAKVARQAAPDAAILLGGANALRPMGRAIAEATLGIFDAVVAGEGEKELSGFVRKLMTGWRPPPDERFVVWPRLPSLSLAPTPEFDDYFEQVGALTEAGRLPEGLPLALPFESARGCWWGERSHCTFCGLVGPEIAERAHTPERVLHDIEHLVATYGVDELRAADDLLPIRIQREVLPELARRQPHRERPLRFFYEVKSHLRRRELELLAAAGVVEVQSGLESLSTDTLKAMKKGVTGPQNVAFLRDARATGVDPLWNWMVAFPGDQREDYEAFLRLAPFVEHLRPPVCVVPVRIDRFSPYHADPARWNIRDVVPFPGMRWAWPEGSDLETISYHFTGTVDSAYVEDPELARRAHEGLDRWLDAWAAGPPELTGVLDGDVLHVRDTRAVALEEETTLSAAATALLLRLEKPRPIDVVTDRALGVLLQRGFVVQHEGYLVSVVVR